MSKNPGILVSSIWMPNITLELVPHCKEFESARSLYAVYNFLRLGQSLGLTRGYFAPKVLQDYSNYEYSYQLLFGPGGPKPVV